MELILPTDLFPFIINVDNLYSCIRISKYFQQITLEWIRKHDRMVISKYKTSIRNALEEGKVTSILPNVYSSKDTKLVRSCILNIIHNYDIYPDFIIHMVNIDKCMNVIYNYMCARYKAMKEYKYLPRLSVKLSKRLTVCENYNYMIFTQVCIESDLQTIFKRLKHDLDMKLDVKYDTESMKTLCIVEDILIAREMKTEKKLSIPWRLINLSINKNEFIKFIENSQYFQLSKKGRR